MVCGALFPRAEAGRSALKTITGTALWNASTNAGIKLATADPEVTTTGTGFFVAFAIPSAKNPASRSSMRT